MYAILSFAALSTRGTAVSFLAEQVFAVPDSTRHRMRAVVLELFHHTLNARLDQKYSDYQPVRVGVPARHAAYSANFVILTVMAGGEVTGRELFPHARNVVKQWTSTTYLWRSQLMSEGWNRLVHTIAVHRESNSGRGCHAYPRHRRDHRTTGRSTLVLQPSASHHCSVAPLRLR
ncbi:hypothetical protein [Actinophytocola sp.]|uniref:hypothetical protein n=1 Tax=Actinophytocola sp. TaxID=1872138 RepID=UPI003D6C2BA6